MCCPPVTPPPGQDNCPFIRTNRIPSSADCCVQPPAPDWVFGETPTVAEQDLDKVANTLEGAIANGTFTSLLERYVPALRAGVGFFSLMVWLSR
jgi:hypothetical protein